MSDKYVTQAENQPKFLSDGSLKVDTTDVFIENLHNKLAENTTEDNFKKEILDIYDINALILKLTKDKYQSFIWNNMALIKNDEGKGCIVDYEAVGLSFSNLDEKLKFDVAEKEEEVELADGSRVASVAMRPYGTIKLSARDIIENAECHQEEAGEFFKKCYGTNWRCADNLDQLLSELEEIGYFDTDTILESVPDKNPVYNDISEDVKDEFEPAGVKIAKIIQQAMDGECGPLGNEAPRRKGRVVEMHSQSPSSFYTFHDDGSVDVVGKDYNEDDELEEFTFSYNNIDDFLNSGDDGWFWNFSSDHPDAVQKIRSILDPVTILEDYDLSSDTATIRLFSKNSNKEIGVFQFDRDDDIAQVAKDVIEDLEKYPEVDTLELTYTDELTNTEKSVTLSDWNNGELDADHLEEKIYDELVNEWYEEWTDTSEYSDFENYVNKKYADSSRKPYYNDVNEEAACIALLAAQFLRKPVTSIRSINWNDNGDYIRVLFDDLTSHYFYSRGVFGQGIKDTDTGVVLQWPSSFDPDKVLLRDDPDTVLENYDRISAQDEAWLDKQILAHGFNIVSKRDYGFKEPYTNVHYQIISNEGNKTKKDLENELDWLDNLLEIFEGKTGSPCTYNMGLQTDGYISCGFDCRATSDEYKYKLLETDYQHKSGRDNNVRYTVVSLPSRSSRQNAILNRDEDNKEKKYVVLINDPDTVLEQWYMKYVPEVGDIVRYIGKREEESPYLNKEAKICYTSSLGDFEIEFEDGHKIDRCTLSSVEPLGKKPELYQMLEADQSTDDDLVEIPDTRFIICVGDGNGAASRGFENDKFYIFETEATNLEQAVNNCEEEIREIDRFDCYDDVKDEYNSYYDYVESLDISGGDIFIAGYIQNGKRHLRVYMDDVTKDDFDDPDKAYLFLDNLSDEEK